MIEWLSYNDYDELYVGGERRVPAVTRNRLKLLLDKIENP
mgnify:CR=1 FL=1